MAFCLVRWTLAERRRLVALISAEILLGSVVFFARFNETLYGGPRARRRRGVGAEDPEAASRTRDRLGTWSALWLDPVARAAALGAGARARAVRGRGCCGARGASACRAVIPERREAELAAGLLLAVVRVQWLLAAFGNDSPDGRGSPGCR